MGVARGFAALFHGQSQSQRWTSRELSSRFLDLQTYCNGI